MTCRVVLGYTIKVLGQVGIQPFDQGLGLVAMAACSRAIIRPWSAGVELANLSSCPLNCSIFIYPAWTCPGSEQKLPTKVESGLLTKYSSMGDVTLVVRKYFQYFWSSIFIELNIYVVDDLDSYCPSHILCHLGMPDAQQISLRYE